MEEDSPRMAISRRPVLMEWVRSDICFSWKKISAPRLEIFSGSPYEVIGLPDLIWRLLQSSLRRVDPPVALIDILLHISHIVVFESVFALVRRGFIFGLERFAMDLGAGAEVLLGVCEEVVRTCADNIGAANFWICDGQLSVS